MSKLPLLVLSDNPASSTGLARITRELVKRIHANLSETFEVATYGLGGVASKKLPWQQYVISKLDNWAPLDLPRVWRDFAGDRTGVALAIWNPSWLPWLADCEKMPNGELKKFLRAKPFERWLYAPVDAEGPNGKMPEEIFDVCGKMDRTLFYTEFASEMYRNTSGSAVKSFPHLPHGTDTGIFYPQDRAEVRKTFIKTVTGGDPMELHSDVFMVGCIATNSPRKNWSVVFGICQELIARGVNVGLWAHTDKINGHWNIMGLAKSYGMLGRLIPTTTDLNDEAMAEAYNACDVTIAPGLGEGFGMPIFESIACGVPCIHVDYAGAAEYLPAEYKIKPTGFFSDGWYDHQRPVSEVSQWADAIQKVTGTKAELPPELAWDNLWPRWAKWLLDGVNGETL